MAQTIGEPLLLEIEDWWGIGKYVIFLDSDDFWTHLVAANVPAYRRVWGLISVCAEYYNFNCLRGVEEKSNAVLKTGYLQGVDVFSSANMPATLFPQPVQHRSKLYRRDFLIAHNHYFQDLGNSNDVFLRFYICFCGKNSVCAGVFDSLSSCQTGKLAK